MKIHVRAPATTANIGPGFDCVAAALDLWNEVEVEEGDGEVDESHLGVQAFALLAPVEGRRFEFVSRIPRERGLGSSAAVIALGLVAGAVAAGQEPNPEELLALGVELEGHPDNLAAALAGGVCLTWENRIARVADRLPAVPFALVPEATVSTAEARNSLPDSVPHADAAFTDGVTEARDQHDNEFGDDRVATLVSSLAGESARTICDRLLASVEAFTGGSIPDDDRTVVIAKIT